MKVLFFYGYRNRKTCLCLGYWQLPFCNFTSWRKFQVCCLYFNNFISFFIYKGYCNIFKWLPKDNNKGKLGNVCFLQFSKHFGIYLFYFFCNYFIFRKTCLCRSFSVFLFINQLIYFYILTLLVGFMWRQPHKHDNSNLLRVFFYLLLVFSVTLFKTGQ